MSKEQPVRVQPIESPILLLPPEQNIADFGQLFPHIQARVCNPDRTVNCIEFYANPTSAGVELASALKAVGYTDQKQLDERINFLLDRFDRLTHDQYLRVVGMLVSFMNAYVPGVIKEGDDIMRMLFMTDFNRDIFHTIDDSQIDVACQNEKRENHRNYFNLEEWKNDGTLKRAYFMQSDSTHRKPDRNVRRLLKIDTATDGSYTSDLFMFYADETSLKGLTVALKVSRILTEKQLNALTGNFDQPIEANFFDMGDFVNNPHLGAQVAPAADIIDILDILDRHSNPWLNEMTGRNEAPNIRRESIGAYRNFLANRLR